MCDPIVASTLIIATIGAAATTASVIQNNKKVQATMDGVATAKQADLNAIAAQQGAIDDGTTGAALAVQAEAARARATLKVAQGESGLVGPTQLRELADQKDARDANLATIEANRASANAQLADKTMNVDLTSKSRMNAAGNQAIGQFAAGLQIMGAAGAGAETGYTAGKKIYPDKTLPTKATAGSGWSALGDSYPTMAGGTS